MADRTEYTYSVVIPLYRSEKTIAAVVSEVQQEFVRIGVDDYEIILVNDCSPDGVMDVVKELVSEDSRIVGIELAKNVGQTQAVMCGLRRAEGDFVIVMDDDMQTPGNEIGNLIDAILERDDDVVFASYDEEGNNRSLIRRFGTRFNWWMAEKLAGKPKGIETNSFRIMRKLVRDEYIKYNGHQVYGYGVIFRTTCHVSNIRMHHRERAVGRSGFTLKKLIETWVTGALSFSPIPLRIAMYTGFFIMVISLIGMLVGALIHRVWIGLFWGFGLLFSFQLIALGLLGEYVSRIFAVDVRLPYYTVRHVFEQEPENTAKTEVEDVSNGQQTLIVNDAVKME